MCLARTRASVCCLRGTTSLAVHRRCLQPGTTFAGMAPADSEAEQTEACNRRTVRYLVAGFACWMFGAQLTRASQVELLLSTFNGGELTQRKPTTWRTRINSPPPFPAGFSLHYTCMDLFTHGRTPDMPACRHSGDGQTHWSSEHNVGSHRNLR